MCTYLIYIRPMDYRNWVPFKVAYIVKFDKRKICLTGKLQRVSEHFKSIETHFFFFENFREREAQNAREQSERDARAKREARGSEATE